MSPKTANDEKLPMDCKFASRMKRDKKSVMHLKSIERQRELISKLTPDSLLDYLSLPQEDPKDECAIELPPRSFTHLV